MKPHAHVVHSLPGRTRFRIPARRHDRAFFADIEKRLRGCPGVKDVESNPITGSLLVHHQGDPATLMMEASQCGIGDLVEILLTAPPVARRLQHEVRTVDRRIQHFTDGELDLSTIASFGLMALAGVQLLRGQQASTAVSLAWYASELIRRWEEPQSHAAASGHH